jgi:hypothetical protein
VTKLIRVGAGVAVALASFLFVNWWRAGASTVNFVWDYDFSADPACSATITTDCVKEFQIRQGTTTVLTVPAPAGASAPLVGVAGTVTLGRPYGPRTFTAIAVSEAGVESDPSNPVQVFIKPGAPQTLRTVAMAQGLGPCTDTLTGVTAAWCQPAPEHIRRQFGVF